MAGTYFHLRAVHEQVLCPLGPPYQNSTMSLSETAECGYNPSHREELQMSQEQQLREQSTWNRFLNTPRVNLDFEA
jgi:hypothetical protein